MWQTVCLHKMCDKGSEKIIEKETSDYFMTTFIDNIQKNEH